MDVDVEILRTLTGGGSRCRLRLLGSFDVAPELLRPSGRKARALLAWLALTDKPVPRDRAAAMLWSRSAEAQAHASLRQCLVELRAFTKSNPPLLVVERDRLYLRTDRVGSDAVDLETFATAGDADGLAMLMPDSPGAPLADLDGIDPMFDEWLSGERARLHERVLRAALACIEQALATGRTEAARRLTAQLCDFDPTSEAAARAEMSATAARGDRDGVRRAWRRIERVLSEDLAVKPADETRAHYRHLASAPLNLPAATQSADDTPFSASRSRPFHRLALAGAGAVVLVAVVTLGIGRPATPAKTNAIRVESVAGATDRESHAFARNLSADLARFASATGVAISVDDVATSRSHLLVKTAVERHADRLEVQARLVSPENNAVLWSRTFSGKVDYGVGLRERTAASLAVLMRCALAASDGRPDRFDAGTLSLVLAVCDATYDDPARVRLNAQRLVVQRPDLAVAWAWLAKAQANEAADAADRPVAARWRALALRNARKAMSIDPDLGLAHFVLALVEHDDDLASIRTLPRMERAFRVDPEMIEGFSHYATTLFNAGYVGASVRPALHSTTLNPIACVMHSATVRRLLAAGRTAEAFAFQAMAERLWPDHPAVLEQRLRMMLEHGDPDAALALRATRTRAEGRVPDAPPLMVHMANWRRDPAGFDRRALDADAKAEFAIYPSSAWVIASVYARIGDEDQALRWLGRAPVRGVHDQWSFLFLPQVAALRRDPRFFAKMGELGLVDIWQERKQWPDFCYEPGLRYDCRAEAKRLLERRAGRAIGAKARSVASWGHRPGVPAPLT